MELGCYIWYSEEGPGRAAAPPSLILAVAIGCFPYTVPATWENLLGQWLKCVPRRNWVSWIISWPWNLGKWSLKIIQTGTMRKLGCGFLFAFHSGYGRIFNRLWDSHRQSIAWPWRLGLGLFKVCPVSRRIASHREWGLTWVAYYYICSVTPKLHLFDLLWICRGFVVQLFDLLRTCCGFHGSGCDMT